MSEWTFVLSSEEIHLVAFVSPQSRRLRQWLGCVRWVILIVGAENTKSTAAIIQGKKYYEDYRNDRNLGSCMSGSNRG